MNFIGGYDIRTAGVGRNAFTLEVFMLSEDIAVIEKGWLCEQSCCTKELAAWRRIKTALVELGTAPNSQSASALSWLESWLARCGCSKDTRDEVIKEMNQRLNGEAPLRT